MNYVLYAVIAILVLMFKPLDLEVFSDSSSPIQSDLPCDYNVYALIGEERMDTIPRKTKFITVQVAGSEDCGSEVVVVQEMRLHNDPHRHAVMGPKINLTELNLTKGDWILEVTKAARRNAAGTFSPITVQAGTIHIK